MAYWEGAGGAGAGGAGAALGEDRACTSACGGRRGGSGAVDDAGAAVPVMSCGCRWAGGGSAVMMLTGGVEAADGEERVLGVFVAGVGAGAGALVGRPRGPAAEQPAGAPLRAASEGPSAGEALTP